MPLRLTSRPRLALRPSVSTWAPSAAATLRTPHRVAASSTLAACAETAGSPTGSTGATIRTVDSSATVATDPTTIIASCVPACSARSPDVAGTSAITTIPAGALIPASLPPVAS